VVGGSGITFSLESWCLGRHLRAAEGAKMRYLNRSGELGNFVMKQFDIVDMFLVLDSLDHESFRTGQIVGAIGYSYLVQFDKVSEADHPLPLELFTLEELGRVCAHCGQKLANLFKSREDLDRWIAWLNTTPDKPTGESGQVVSLKKPH
jgi:hypothetical protein